jgi:hypothetical protein
LQKRKRGVYDINSKIAADPMEKLRETVTQKVRNMGRVRSTLTLIMMEE